MTQPRFIITLLALPSGDHTLACIEYLQTLSPRSSMEKILDIATQLPVTLTHSASEQRAEEIVDALNRFGARVEKRAAPPSPAQRTTCSQTPSPKARSEIAKWLTTLLRDPFKRAKRE